MTCFVQFFQGYGNHTLVIGSFFIKVIESQLVWSFCIRRANENLGKQWDPCIIGVANLKVNFTKKNCALYTGKYGMW